MHYLNIQNIKHLYSTNYWFYIKRELRPSKFPLLCPEAPLSGTPYPLSSIFSDNLTKENTHEGAENAYLRLPLGCIPDLIAHPSPLPPWITKQHHNTNKIMRTGCPTHFESRTYPDSSSMIHRILKSLHIDNQHYSYPIIRYVKYFSKCTLYTIRFCRFSTPLFGLFPLTEGGINCSYWAFSASFSPSV